ncbi:MAG: hypothetical protein II748_02510 [Clostridia bacterium]|nr:hypothetical protein [Clostridia bacterium]
MNKISNAIKLFIASLCLGLCSGLFFACTGGGGNVDNTPRPVPAYTEEEDVYNNRSKTEESNLAAFDDLGRKTVSAGKMQSDKQVGMFYFLWMGAHGTNLYDNTEILKNDPEAYVSEEAWTSAGGGYVGAAHFWGRPLFGYYYACEEWVIRKHIQMLADAGVDFLVFDTTNSTGSPSSGTYFQNGGNNNTYIEAALTVAKTVKEYMDSGRAAPKIAFYTNSNSGKAMDVIYEEFYKAHGEYKDTWYEMDGKPMIVGVTDSASKKVKEFFTLKESQWPFAQKSDNGFPWMEFQRLLTDDSVYEFNGRKIMSVSVAQHNVTCRMSAAAWYGGQDRTRSWHDGAVDKSEGAVLRGYNFAEQWEFAIAHDPDIVFVTGWNEWGAQRQSPSMFKGEPITFIDTATMEASRDIEPMSGGYGDNYYMQLVNYIGKFKKTSSNAEKTNGTFKEISVEGPFSQWDDVETFYMDYERDVVNRNAEGFGNTFYSDNSGLNDFLELKVCHDDKNAYFFAKTAEKIRDFAGENRMNLYIRTGDSGKMYDYVFGTIKPSEGFGTLSACADDGLSAGEKVTDVRYRIKDDLVMTAIPLDALKLDPNEVRFTFKWFDGETVEDVFSFYTGGDAAPYGRLNYIYNG